MAYVIVCKEPDVDAYVLPDGHEAFEGAKQLMQFRGEEFVDEMVTTDAENEVEVGELEINMSEDGSCLTVTPIADGVKRAPILSMFLQAVIING